MLQEQVNGFLGLERYLEPRRSQRHIIGLWRCIQIFGDVKKGCENNCQGYYGTFNGRELRKC